MWFPRALRKVLLFPSSGYRDQGLPQDVWERSRPCLPIDHKDSLTSSPSPQPGPLWRPSAACLFKRRTIRQDRWRETNRATWRQEEGEHQLTALSWSHAADWSTPAHTHIRSWRETTRKYKQSREIQRMRRVCILLSKKWLLNSVFGYFLIWCFLGQNYKSVYVSIKLS